MTTTGSVRTRRGFTLVELLVVMALIAMLAALVLTVAPHAMQRDRSAEAVNTLTGALQIARSRAMRDGLPRGVRLIPDPDNPQFASTFQPIESPAAFVPNPDGAPWAGERPYVRFDYTAANPDGSGPVVPNGRQCRVFNLTADQLIQIQNAVSISTAAPGAARTLLVLPTLGTSHAVVGASPGTTPNSLLLNLENYPDAYLGGQLHWRTYHFGFYTPPRPLLGEPVMPLPRDTAVDLSLSSPAGAPNVDHDILFSSSGQLISTASTGGVGQVFLVIRDPARPSPALDPARAGEVMVLAIKAKTGGIGAAPWTWPPEEPFTLARRAVTAR